MAEREALAGRSMIWLVAHREIRERMRAKSFLVGTALLVLLIVGVGVVSRVAGDDGGVTEIGIAADRTPALDATFRAVATSLDREVKITYFDDAAGARAAVRDGDVDVAVDPDRNEAVFEDDVDDSVLGLVRQSWSRFVVEERLGRAGLESSEIAEVFTTPQLDAVTADGDDQPSGLSLLTGTVSVVLLFMSLQTFGTYVLTGVVEEKSSAVVELLLARSRADRLLAGKLLGIGTVALVQFAAAIGAGLASLALSGVDVPGEIWAAVPMMLVWFLGGFALYSTLFAIAGALVSRQEDAQSAAAPIGYGLAAAYLLVFIFGYAPNSLPSLILSLVPPTAPFLMPMRMAAGAAAAWEVAVAIVGLLLATFAAAKLAGRIYEQVVLHRGARVRWRDAVWSLRH